MFLSVPYSGRLYASTANCSLGVLRNVTTVYLAQGLPPQPALPTMAISSRRNLRAFLFCKIVSCEMLQRFTPHRVCHPNPLRQLWQSTLREIRELFCFAKLFLAKCYSGLPHTGFATSTHSANYGNRLSEKSESFFVLISLLHHENSIDKHP